MINLWKYADAKKIRIIDNDDIIWDGNMGDVNDVEDEDEDYGFKEDSITIWIDGRPITFPQSEIKSIEVIE